MNKFTLLNLQYPYDALEPYIDSKTMEIHHQKHHQAYIDKLNAALEKYPEFFEKSIEDILKDLNSVPEDVRTAVRNHGGGHYNHLLFWNFLRPFDPLKNLPSGKINEAINSFFGNFESFKEKFKNTGLNQFGSGWVWLVKDKDELKIISTPNQDSPISQNLYPLLGIDVWEHAYYLKYQNRRMDYLGACFNVINWDEVEKRFLENK